MREPRVFHLIQLAHSALFRAADRALKALAGLSSAQQAVLFVLTLRGSAPITAIAEQLKMGKSSLTGLIDRMSENGLVERRPSPSDGRSLEVFILPDGKRAVEATLAGTRKINAELLAPFSEDERAVIERFLQHVSENAETIVSRHSRPTLRTGTKP
jgi:DNA-binding MarR family transcriptional regulator